ncbi:S1C family serine protease [Pelagicoccus mobilis]|uniref:PDZ domain-containing protein n=1 Tax=Pelagicoccus mobilis TaxID=415221 RepID=A0A934VNH4_9BACT|nr:PDZ domain-containing protein [Pelagicoccus mobilis]MBK1879951.1 PDZ domain-containing protein [Pelagicoccus mobilis]
MLRAVRLSAFLGSLLVCYSLNAEPGASLTSIEQRLVSLYQQHKDAVVKVKVATKKQSEKGREQVELTVLSGFFIDENGTVLTNAVPTHEGPRLRVEKDGAQFLAVPIGSDPISNLALIQLAKPPETLSYIDVSQAADVPPVGSIAYSITSPLDFSATPKLGLVGGQESSFGDIAFPFTYTRVGIKSGPAEGGSPVFNKDGQLIGISVATLPEIDSSYIVAGTPLQSIIKQLRSQANVTHPVIKAKFEERGSPIDLSRRVIITKVEPNSAAEKSGLLAGDQIISFQDKPLTSLNQFRDDLFFSEAGSFASLMILRGDEQKEITILLEKK